jgi:hypothetical protein
VLVSLRSFILPLILISAFFCFDEGKSQEIDHWETIVYSNQVWNYFVGLSEPDSNWRKIDFNDDSWLEGIGGIGYGDGDDSTEITQTTSLYLRRVFTIQDTGKIAKAIFNIDYDDAFVAYINDVEIARANIGIIGDHPSHLQTGVSSTEAQMYQGDVPEYYFLDKEIVSSTLMEGENVLAIQVHNLEFQSSDLSAIPFLSVGIINNSMTYFWTPEWFKPDFEFTSSNLPIIMINTNGQTIRDEPRIIAEMGIINNPNNFRNSLIDPFTDYNGRISIEIRGTASQMFAKKSYCFETQDEFGENLDVSLLGMPEENDWILYAPYSDKSLLRNVLTYHLYRQMGHYNSRTKFCELTLNGEYRGIYVLMEKIKTDKNRVNISKLTPDEITGDEVTGGYIIRVDKQQGLFRGWQSSINPIQFGNFPIFFQYYSPHRDKIVPEQEGYIQNYFYNFETTLMGDNFVDPTNGYAKYINVNTFIDFFIINELSKDIDGYRFSVFMYKDKDSHNDKLNIGPVWDKNIGFGNVDYGYEGAMFTNDWMYNKGGERIYWFERLMQDNNFRVKLVKRWNELRQNVLHFDNISSFIDNMGSQVNEAQERNFNRWPIIGKYVWPNYIVGQTYSQELWFLKDWIESRLNWIDQNISNGLVNIQDNSEQNEITSNLFHFYPNPFSNIIRIDYKLKKPGYVNIRIFNPLGQKIKSFDANHQTNSISSVFWDGRDELGQFVSKGIYFYTAEMNGQLLAKGKIIKLK